VSVLHDLLVSVFSVAFVAQTVRITVPYVLAALGGSMCERSGIVDLALEAKLLMGAFAAAIITYETGSIALAIAGAAAAGALVGAAHAFWSIRLRADQIVTGIALNMAAFGITRYLLQLWYGQSANSPRFAGVGTAVWTSPLVWLAVGLTALAIVLVARTRFGLRIRAAGERPDAAAAAGVSVTRTRLGAILAGSAIAGVGGAQLSLAVNGFVAEMSSGRGYVALAAVIMGGWRPAWVALVCLLPYVLALVLLATVRSRGRTPSALGRPHDR
jgi:ABC-type uncharacterized transport system permease subunit